MEKGLEDKKIVLKTLKRIMYEKAELYKEKKAEFRFQYKKYKQLIQNEKELADIVEKLYGKNKLNDYKKLFQAQSLRNQIYALYFQTKVLKTQIFDLKAFFDKDYYNSMSHIAKAICKNSTAYNFYVQKEKEFAYLEQIVTRKLDEPVKKYFYEKYNKGKEKIDSFSL